MESIKLLRVYFWFTLIISIIYFLVSFKTTMFYHFFLRDSSLPYTDIMMVKRVIDFPLVLSIFFDLLLTVTLPIVLIWIPYVIITYMRNRRSKLA